MKKRLLLGSLLSIVTTVTYADAPTPQNEEPLLFETPSFLRELFAILGNDPTTPCYFKPEWPSQYAPGHNVPILICEVPGFKLKHAPGTSEDPQKDPKDQSSQAPGTSQTPPEAPQKDPEDQPPPNPRKVPEQSDNLHI